MPYLPLNEYGVAAPPGHVIYDPPVAPPQPRFVPVQQVGGLGLGLRGLGMVPRMMSTAEAARKHGFLSSLWGNWATGFKNVPAVLANLRHAGNAGLLRESMKSKGGPVLKDALLRVRKDLGSSDKTAMTRALSGEGWRDHFARRELLKQTRRHLAGNREFRALRQDGSHIAWRQGKWNEAQAKKFSGKFGALRRAMGQKPTEIMPGDRSGRILSKNLQGVHRRTQRSVDAKILRGLRAWARSPIAPALAAAGAGAYAADLPAPAPPVPMSATGRDPREYDAYIGQKPYPAYTSQGAF